MCKMVAFYKKRRLFASSLIIILVSPSSHAIFLFHGLRDTIIMATIFRTEKLPLIIIIMKKNLVDLKFILKLKY